MADCRLFLDCEYNGFGGKLISMALVSGGGSHEFYEVLPCLSPSEWVEVNVMPVLLKQPIPPAEFKKKLAEFLNQWNSVHIVADWYEDIAHLCRVVITGPGKCLPLPWMTFEVVRGIDDHPEIPHNALSDARAIRTAYLERQ